mgnify:CR=1 FL=1
MLSPQVLQRRILKPRRSSRVSLGSSAWVFQAGKVADRQRSRSTKRHSLLGGASLFESAFLSAKSSARLFGCPWDALLSDIASGLGSKQQPLIFACCTGTGACEHFNPNFIPSFWLSTLLTRRVPILSGEESSSEVQENSNFWQFATTECKMHAATHCQPSQQHIWRNKKLHALRWINDATCFLGTSRPLSAPFSGHCNQKNDKEPGLLSMIIMASSQGHTLIFQTESADNGFPQDCSCHSCPTDPHLFFLQRQVLSVTHCQTIHFVLSLESHRIHSCNFSAMFGLIVSHVPLFWLCECNCCQPVVALHWQHSVFLSRCSFCLVAFCCQQFLLVKHLTLNVMLN